MVNADHYAIVVGVSHYPALGEPPDKSADLKGPENDVDAICAWLKSAGGVPEANIKVVKSSTYLPFDPPAAGKPPTRERAARLPRHPQGPQGRTAALRLRLRPRLLAQAQPGLPVRGQRPAALRRHQQ